MIRALLALLLVLVLGDPLPALAGPVDWQELPASVEGRQWWDAGSLRVNRQGNLTVLSRFQPAAEQTNAEAGAPAQRQAAGSLYVMEIDCGQTLFRDTSINGFPQWNSSWQPAGPDGLIEETIAAVCAAGAPLLAGS
ncbi:MAG: hypothetical protein ACKN83_06915 [Vulcanococcus sp.]